MVIKVKAHLELNLERNVTSKKKKSFYRYISSKEKMRENVGPLLHGVGNMVKKDGKSEVLHAFFASVINRKICLQESQGPEKIGKPRTKKVSSVEKHGGS